MWRTACVCLCVAIAVTALGLGDESSSPLVTISQGQLKGTLLQTRGGRQISAFQGIPYASPPIGTLRFQAPTPPESWEGLRDASHPGSPCVQPNHTTKVEVIGQEDCLYLNVYTHKVSNTSKLPVMVYVHGGGFHEGWGHMYRPDYMMDKDIVLVTLTYRLGVLGFLSLEDKEMPGNNGMKDQAAALRWVRDNIAQFGGDPEAVTVFGESAGAASVHLLMLSPLSKGLFQRAICQSGTAYGPWAVRPVGQAQTYGQSFAAHLGCNHFTINDTLTCLRDMPAYVLVDIAQGMKEWDIDPLILFGPSIEPEGTEAAFLMADPWTLSSSMPWVTGVTSSEGSVRADSFKPEKIIELNEDFEIYGPISLFLRTAENSMRTALAVKKFYFLDGDIKPENFDGLNKMYMDCWFLHPAKESLRRHRGPKYFYYFDYKGANSVIPDHEGVGHFDEMQYFFPLQDHFKNFNVSAEDEKISEKLVTLWTNFATFGKPTSDSSDVKWTESVAGEFLNINKSGFVMERDLLAERDKFWGELPYRNKYPTEKKTIEKDEL